MVRFIDKAISELVAASGGHQHAAQVARNVLELALSRRELSATGPTRGFARYVASEFEDQMAYNGHPLRGFLQRQLVIAWPHTVERALAKAWRYAWEGS